MSNPDKFEDEINDDEEEVGLKKRLTSSMRPTVSASTVDSYDGAFQRKNTNEKMMRRRRPPEKEERTERTERIFNAENDTDFFDS